MAAAGPAVPETARTDGWSERMAQHRIEAGPNTVHWGYFDAALPPVLTVASGDTVAISTVSGGPDVMPAPPLHVPEALRAVQGQVPNRLPGHMCTGPVAVRGAKPGHVLEVRIEAIELHYDWGYTYAAPLKGALPEEVAERHLIHIPLDRTRMVGRLPWGLELPLKPFFGVMAVAPPAGWGMVSTLPPRRNGGNLDNKELVAGTTLYLPVYIEGANFSVGDGHGIQGDGEVCVTAIETGLIGTFTLVLRDDMRLDWPMAETPTHVMTMAFDPDLDTCAKIALDLMIGLIAARTGLSRAEAYMLCSLAADLKVTQVVNGNNGIHCMLPKSCLVGRS
jgi:acetamidase/formamidase